MDLDLKGRHALVTGASRGIGWACARLFLTEGARVTLVARDAGRLAEARERLLAVCPGAEVAVQAADLRDAAAADQMVSAAEAGLGPVDILVNSAGAARRTPPDELTPQAWHDAMDAKYFSYIHVIDPLIKRMAARGQGVIVNIVGMGGKVATPVHLPGGSANAALMLASAGLANAYASRGLRVNVVNPGITRTERMQEGLEVEARQTGSTPDAVLARTAERLPLRRVAEADEIAQAVLFLASPRASYVNGAVLAMDGGLNPIVV